MNHTEFLVKHSLQYSFYLEEAKAFRKIIKEVNTSYVIVCKEELGIKVGRLQMYNFYVHCPTTSFANAYARIGMLYTERILPIWNNRHRPKVKGFKDMFGLKVEGIATADTDADKIEALEKHLDMLEGLTNEAMSSIERKIAELKHPSKTKNKKK